MELLLGPATELVITSCCIKSTFHHMSQSNWETVHSCCIEKEKATLQNYDFFFFFTFSQLMRHPLIESFHLSNLLQMSNDCKTVDVEFFSSFSCSRKRIHFNDSSQLVTVNIQWPATTPSSSRLLSSLQRSCFLNLLCKGCFLNHHCTVHSLAVPGPNVLLVLQAGLCCFTIHFELK